MRPAGRDPTTSDKDILCRRRLPIDLDAERPAGISATNAEHEAAIQRARDMFRFLVSDLRWPEPVIGDSGNGAHVVAAINLPADDGGLVERCLKALAARFDTAAVKVDTATHNPARIWKLYGTLACKGDHTNRSAFIIQQANGAIGAGCHHNGCSGKGWHELRDMVEPGWRERRAERRSQTVAPKAESWPEPRPLPTELPPVQAFSFDLLPEAAAEADADWGAV